jgi:hypothetical protein
MATRTKRTVYRAGKRSGGDVVFEKRTAAYEGPKVFPQELRDPTEDTVTLYIDGVVVGVQVPLNQRNIKEG